MATPVPPPAPRHLRLLRLLLSGLVLGAALTGATASRPGERGVRARDTGRGGLAWLRGAKGLAEGSIEGSPEPGLTAGSLGSTRFMPLSRRKTGQGPWEVSVLPCCRSLCVLASRSVPDRSARLRISSGAQHAGITYHSRGREPAQGHVLLVGSRLSLLSGHLPPCLLDIDGLRGVSPES